MHFATTSVADTDLMERIAERITADQRSPYEDKMSAIVELVVTHAKACPLDLTALLAASDDDFWHDVLGIAQNLDRQTFSLANGFQPRHAAPTTTRH